MTSLQSMYQNAQAQRQQMIPTGQTHVVSPQNAPQGQAPQQVVPQAVVVDRVDPAKLMDAWQKYMLKIKESNGQLYGSMGAGPRIASDGVTIELRIASQYEVDNIEKNVELCTFLREATGNNHLVIKAVIDPTIAKQREVIYTATQKLDKMIEKNPKIRDFINDLGLSLS